MLYNAIIKEVDKKKRKGEVIGRILLKDLSLIPPTWTIIFRGVHLKQNADVGKLMCTAKDPISIYKGHVPMAMGEDLHARVPVVKPNPKISITVDNREGKKINFRMKLHDTLQKMKEKVQVEWELPAGSFTLRLQNKVLRGNVKTLKTARIEDGSVIFLYLKEKDNGQIPRFHPTTRAGMASLGVPLYTAEDQSLVFEKLKLLKSNRIVKKYKAPCRCSSRGTRTVPRKALISAQNVEKQKVIKDGAAPTHDWNLYGFGMNFYGDCINKECPSRKGKVKDGVSFTAGYGEVLLTPKRFMFPCPACKDEKEDTIYFPVKEFVLCNGRSLFRFKKSGVGQEVKTVILESLEEDIMKYATFDGGKGGNSKSDYDYIEITTVKSNCSLHFCVKCDERIKQTSEEVILTCGHVYHAKCHRVTINTLYDDDSLEESSDDDSSEESSGVDSNHDGDHSRSNNDCSICRVNQIDNFYQLLWPEGEDQDSADSPAALLRELRDNL